MPWRKSPCFPGRRQRRSGPLREAVLLPNDQRHPQPHNIDRRPDDASDVEELRRPVGPMVVMDRHLGDPKPGVLDLLHHLQTDDTAAFLQHHSVEYRAPQQPKVVIDIAQSQAEQRLDQVVMALTPLYVKTLVQAAWTISWRARKSVMTRW